MNTGTMSGLSSGITSRKIAGILAATGPTPGSTSIAPMAAVARCAQVFASSPAADINALVQIVGVAGQGRINWAAVFNGGSTHNLRAVLEIDGVVIFDQNYGTPYSDFGFVMLGGGQSTSTANVVFQPIEFSSGFRILAGCSVSGASLTARFNAEVYQ